MSVPWGAVLFFFAFGSRAVLMAAVCHWSALGTAALVGDQLDSVLWVAPSVLVVSALIMAALLIFLNQDGRVSARMHGGAKGLEGQSIPLILMGAASNVGGILLWLQGAVPPAVYSIALGAVVMITEALILYFYKRVN